MDVRKFYSQVDDGAWYFIKLHQAVNIFLEKTIFTAI